MIKILIIVSSNEVNGTEKVALEIAKNLNPQKFEVYFAIPKEGNISNELCNTNIKEIIFNDDGINVITFKGARNLFSIIKKNKFDIVHSHSSSIPGLVSKIAKVNLKIETRHGLFYSDFELEHLSIKRFFFEYIKKFYFDLITTVSENDKKRLSKYFKYDEDKMETIYNGLNLDIFESYRKDYNQIASGDFLIGNVGRLSYQKNHKLLLNVFSKLISKFPNIRLQIIGDGELKNELLKQIEELNLRGKVELIPYQKNIYEYISKFDLMVMTSRYEGVPLVILEAMAIGVPVASSDVGGINEIINDGRTGILINSFCEDNFVKKISELINNSEKIKEISFNASKEIQNFSVENMVKNYEDLYLRHLNK